MPDPLAERAHVLDALRTALTEAERYLRGGVLTTGATMANFTALAAARR